MSSWVGAILLVVGFVLLMRRFGLVERTVAVTAIARRSLQVVRDGSMSDEAKEHALQKDAIDLLRSFVLLASGGAAAVLLPVALVWAAERLDWVSLEGAFAVAVSPAFLIGSAVLVILALLVPKKTAGRYSPLDRALHRIAFASYGPQTLIADLEDRLFAKQLAGINAERPVFVTALPRAGTTLLLECLAKLPDFASHGYRDMPFVLMPCLWNRFSRRFQRTGQPHQRAHGDGMLIDFDSPEALEEVVWKTFWPRHYCRDRIVPWQEERHEEFAEFLRKHMRKIILLRRGSAAPAARYVSKNNANIARAGTLRGLFPDAATVVLFRQPLDHAASLLAQHQNFSRIHAEDRFASAYMRAIGHYDFGANLRPIDFDGWLDKRRAPDSDSLAFWLDYWIAAYSHLLTQRGQVHLASYEALCENPRREFDRLADAIGIVHRDVLAASVPTVRMPRPKEIAADALDSSVVEAAKDIYANLREASSG